MIQTENIQTVSNEQLLTRLASLRDVMLKNQDGENVEKLEELMKKVNTSDYMIGFSGHFSAGKSSMINELIGESLLPSSPIPTSANLVKVKTGREYARLYHKDKKITEFPAPYDYNVLKEYCKDGETIESIEISHQSDQLPEGVTILDTPGIDSTDDAHRLSTESALHLADLLFYVMDYNHVLSELNFQFTKELTDRNKTLYLIVNQIDKHKESEVRFADFQQGVEQAFRNWNVKFSRIFYTTLKKDDNPKNELQQVKDLLVEKLAKKDELLAEGVYHSANQIILDHLSFLDEKNSYDLEEPKNLLSSLGNVETENILTEIDELTKQLEQLRGKRTEISESYMTGVETILSNAILMPFQTRELAKSYLESMQSDFKVGLLFSKGKTEKEREDRLQRFFEDVDEKVATQLGWHVKDFVSSMLKELKLTTLLPKVQDLAVTIEPKDLQTLIKQGARVTGDYILVYTNDVSDSIKRKYKQKTIQFLDELLEQYVKNDQPLENKLVAELTQYNKYREAFETVAAYERDRNDVRVLLDELLSGKQLSKVSVEDVKVLLLKATEKIEISSTDEIKAKLRVEKENPIEKPVQQKSDSTTNIEQAISQIESAQQLIQSITGLSTIAKDIGSKVERLKHNHFTVALFGAFSAGKSSFANALMGEHILPVSPNPTTATINKITFPTGEYKHETVLVKVKSEKQLLQDIDHSLQIFGLKAHSVQSALEIIQSNILNIERVEAKEKPHYSFLEAVVSGYDEISEHLDGLLTTDLTGFNEYVAKEEKACFVEWIELYYDCPLTRQGITLVDTPGADSINARHTGVAFEYIKNADAVLFVTYYNHAFSKADREFLIQLGRVKDTFSMDKMFFLINAADLANSEEELEDVKDYVESQLIGYGIRFPRLYPISSRMALMEKKNEDVTGKYGILQTSGIHSFEHDFQTFIVEELTEVAVNAAYSDVSRARSIIDSYIQSARESIDVKKIKQSKAKQAEDEIISVISKLDRDQPQAIMSQEIHELIFYIKQRVFLRYPDMFKEAFNPSALRDDGKDMKKALDSCLQDLLNSFGYDLAQEMRATSLRIEAYITKMIKDQVEALNYQCQTIDEKVSISSQTDFEFTTLNFEDALKDEEKARYKKALSIFKNPKSFFEKNEKKYMVEEIQVQLQEPVDQYIAVNEARLKENYQDHLNEALTILQNKAIQEVSEYFQGVQKMLSDNIDVAQLEKVYQQLIQIGKIS